MKTVIEYRLKISPWLTVWTRPAETASRLKDTGWVWGGGLVPYVIMGVVGTLEASPYPTIIVDTSDTPLSVLILLVPFSLSLIAALVARMMWVNFIYYTGKIWNGTATKRGIDTVLSLSLMPQLLCALSLLLNIIPSQGPHPVSVNSGVQLICAILSSNITIIALARVQRFRYSLAILNMAIPTILLIIIALFIRELR
jgi:hypothetical protein